MTEKDAPPLKIFEHSRAEGFSTLNGEAPFAKDANGIQIEGTIELIQYSSDGELAAIFVGEQLTIYRTADGSQVSSFQHAKIKMIAFSPLNNLLQTWKYHEKPQPGVTPPDNLVLWSVETGERLHSWLKKSFSSSNWPLVKWTSDESVAALMGAGRVDFFAGRHFGAVVRSFKLPDISHFQWAPGTTIPHKFAAFVPEKKGQPGRVMMCNYPETGTVIVQKSIFKAQAAHILWNQQGTAALLVAETDVDTSGKSYYGETGVHLLNAVDGSCTNVRPSLDKQGPIYETVWSPKGDKFVVVYGSMPAKTTLFNLKLERLMEFPMLHRNTAIFAPHGHTLIIGGFGNLAGTMDVWDVKRGRKISSIEAPCTTQCTWSPCSTYILTATLTPRLRVDNGWKIWKPTGQLMHHKEVKELYRAIWKPLEAKRYPNVPPRRDASGPKEAATKPAAPATYCPPHLRNRAAADRPAKVEEVTVAQKFVPDSMKKKVATPVGQMSKAALKNKRRAEKKRKAKEEADQAEGAAKPPAAATQGKPAEDPAAGKKRAKALNKKLRQIEALQQKQADGVELNEQELEKVQTEDELRAELSQLDV